jgi:hypothetical protein
VTLGRLVIAWIVVATWFGIATLATFYLLMRVTRSPDPTAYLVILPDYLKRRVAEAAALTLIASLWFDSLGRGEWWLLFGLIGVLVSTSHWFVRPPLVSFRPMQVANIITDVARYVGAGALLAWRFS